MKRQCILFDGEWLEADGPFLHGLTPGVRKRCGAFETLRISAGHVRDLGAHYRRLCRGLRVLAIPAPWTKKALEDLIRILLSRAPDAGRLRVMVWHDRSRPHWSLVPGEYTPPGPELYARGVNVLLVPVRKEFGKEDGIFKPLDYALYRRAFERARRCGCFEALLYRKDGRIIDGSRSSLLLLTDNALVVPPAGYGTLDGLMRRKVIALACAAGLRVSRRNVFTRDLALARGAWLVNSLVGMIRIKL